MKRVSISLVFLLVTIGAAYALSLPFSITITAPQTISTTLLNGGTTGTFGSPAPSGAIVGPLSATCSNACANITFTLSTSAPCDGTSGANNSSFSIVTFTSLGVNTGTAAGTYLVCVVASGPGYTNTVAGKFTITGSASTITAVLLNSGSTGVFPAPSVNLTTGSTEAGTLTTTCSGSPCVGITYSLSTSVSNCTSTNGADNASFSVQPTPPFTNGTVLSDGSTDVQTGSSLNPNTALGVGTYHVCVVATGSYPNSPVGAPFVITGTTPVYPKTDGAVAVGPLGRIDTNFLNPVTPSSGGIGQSTVAVPQSWYFIPGTQDSCGFPRALNGTALSGTNVATEMYNNNIYVYTSCGSSFGGPWFQYNRSTGQFTAIGSAAPTEAGIPTQPLWITFSAPACTNPVTVPCKSTAGNFNIPDNTTAGTVLATATIATSDGSTFGGTLSATPSTPFSISTYNIVAARNFTAADDNTTFSTAVKAIPFTQPSVSSVTLAPLTFMTTATNSGAVIADLTATKGQTWGVSQPVYSLCTNCGDDSGLFTLSGNHLLIGAVAIATPRNYKITVIDSEDASNTPVLTAFTLAGVANTGTPNCPSVPPPAVQRAWGVNATLVLCEDFSTAKYATLSNWMYCSSVEAIHNFEWVSGSTQCLPSHFFQDTDPLTGETVLHVFTPGGTGRYQLTTVNGVAGSQTTPNSGLGVDLPAANYVEWIGRNTIAGVVTGNEPSPDWYRWISCPASVLYHQYCSGATVALWWQGWGPIEDDNFEFYGLQGGGAGAIHSIWSVACGNSTTLSTNTCPYWAQDANVNRVNAVDGYTQTVPSWTYGTYADYGSLESNSGSLTNPAWQACAYLNDYLLKNNIGENCYYRDYLQNNGFLYAEQQVLVNRRSMNWWVGGYGVDQNAYVRAIRFWSCSNYKTDPTCAGNGITR